jgi:hypothetical protein
MNDASQSISTTNLSFPRSVKGTGRLLSEFLPWPGGVSVAGVFGHHLPPVVLIQNKPLLQTFFTDRANPARCPCMRCGCTEWRKHVFGPSETKTLSKAVENLAPRNLSEPAPSPPISSSRYFRDGTNVGATGRAGCVGVAVATGATCTALGVPFQSPAMGSQPTFAGPNWNW